MQSLGLLPEQRTSSLAQDPRGLKERRREKEHARAHFLLWSHPQWNPKAQARAGTILQIGRGGFRPASHTPRQKSLPVSSSLCLKFNDPGPSHSLSFIFLSLSLCLPHSLTHFPPSLPLSLTLSLSVFNHTGSLVFHPHPFHDIRQALMDTPSAFSLSSLSSGTNGSSQPQHNYEGVRSLQVCILVCKMPFRTSQLLSLPGEGLMARGPSTLPGHMELNCQEEAQMSLRSPL